MSFPCPGLRIYFTLMEYAVDKGMSLTKKGTSLFAVGLGTKYEKNMPFHAYARDVYLEGAQALLKEQLETAKTYLNRRTGGLERHLSSSPYTVSASGGSVNLFLNYQLKIRFLDLKRNRRGKLKRVYVPIYNKLVWGFVFGRIYKALRYGFTEAIKQKYTEELRNTYNKPI